MSSGAPLDGIAVAVSRQTADGEPEGGWTPDEILPIERALSAYTAGVAYQAFAEDGWGRIDARRQRRPALAGPRPADPLRRWSFPR